MKNNFHLFEVILIHIDGSKSKFISSSVECDTKVAKEIALNNDWETPVKYVQSITYITNPTPIPTHY